MEVELLSSRENLDVPGPGGDPGDKPGSRTGVLTTRRECDGPADWPWECFGGSLASLCIVLRHVGLKAKELPVQSVTVVTRQCLRTLDGSGPPLAA